MSSKINVLVENVVSDEQSYGPTIRRVEIPFCLCFEISDIVACAAICIYKDTEICPQKKHIHRALGNQQKIDKSMVYTCDATSYRMFAVR